jgi:hypothetical protein
MFHEPFPKRTTGLTGQIDQVTAPIFERPEIDP